MDSMTDELDALARRYHAAAGRITELGFISPGSLTRRHTYCGKPGCRCQADPPQPHGPYWQWTRKIAGKTITRRLTADQAAHYAEWIDNQRQLRQLIAEMEQISRQAADLILKQDKNTTTR
jgi:hypothetical protein